MSAAATATTTATTTTASLRRPNDIPVDINNRPSKRRHIALSPSSTLVSTGGACDPCARGSPITPAAVYPAVGGIVPEDWLPNFYDAPPPASPGYLARTPSYPIRAAHRATVVNWLMQLREALNIAPTTLFVSVTIMDRFLCTHPDIRLHLLQLLACACVFISVKTYETEILTAGKLVSLSGGAFDYNSLIQMESIVLNRLHFNIIAMTPLHALGTLARKHGLEGSGIEIAQVAAMMSLTDHVCAEKTPANITLAAIHLAKAISAPDGAVITRVKEGSTQHVKAEPAVCPATNSVPRKEQGDLWSVEVVGTAGRMVEVWKSAVKEHSSGEYNFLVRRHGVIAKAILESAERKEKTKKEEMMEVKGGTTATRRITTAETNNATRWGGADGRGSGGRATRGTPVHPLGKRRNNNNNNNKQLDGGVPLAKQLPTRT